MQYTINTGAAFLHRVYKRRFLKKLLRENTCGKVHKTIIYSQVWHRLKSGHKSWICHGECRVKSFYDGQNETAGGGEEAVVCLHGC